MKIKYLDGRRLYLAFLAGGQAVIKDFAYLNKINVYPVPDGDTGTNLASTMKAIAEQARPSRSAKESLNSIAEAALTGARETQVLFSPSISMDLAGNWATN